MRTAYEAVLYGNIEAINYPPTLKECCTGHVNLVRVQTYSVLVSHLVHVIIIYYIVYLLCCVLQAGGDSGFAFGPKAQKGELFVEN